MTCFRCCRHLDSAEVWWVRSRRTRQRFRKGAALSTEIYRILYEKKDVRLAVKDLLALL
jgi:hypothetical protein